MIQPVHCPARRFGHVGRYGSLGSHCDHSTRDRLVSSRVQAWSSKSLERQSHSPAERSSILVSKYRPEGLNAAAEVLGTSAKDVPVLASLIVRWASVTVAKDAEDGSGTIIRIGLSPVSANRCLPV